MLKQVRHHPHLLLYMVLGWVFFGIITTVLSTYPLLSDYALRAPQVFLHWEAWQGFLVYTYNGLAGGTVNYINTFLFGIWVLCFAVYRSTYIEQGLSIAQTIKMHKTGTWGSLAAILGGGCIGCGFTFLTNIFGAILGSFLVSLPLKGAEIGLIGTVIMIISIYRISRQISEFTPETTVATPLINEPAISESPDSRTIEPSTTMPVTVPLPPTKIPIEQAPTSTS